MKCEEILKMLNDYVDGDIDPEICETLREHLDNCNPCRVVIDNIRQTIELYQENEKQVELPIQFRKRMHDALRTCWQNKQGDDQA